MNAEHGKALFILKMKILEKQIAEHILTLNLGRKTDKLYGIADHTHLMGVLGYWVCISVARKTTQTIPI